MGLSSENKPIGVFLFIGPTGIGKTQVAKSLAEYLFGDEKRMLRYDMGEYPGEHDIYKLIGAPPGFVGYNEGSKLVNDIRDNPVSVILFDEVEKAHPDVYTPFLNLLDEGHITAPNGARGDFTQAIIIMTTNCGVAEFNEALANSHNPYYKILNEFDSETEEFISAKEIIFKNAIEKQFKRPELLARIKQKIIFNSLNKTMAKVIIDNFLRDICVIIKQQLKIKEILYSNDIVEFFVNNCVDAKEGVRGIQNKIEDLFRDKLLSELLEKNIAPANKTVKYALVNTIISVVIS